MNKMNGEHNLKPATLTYKMAYRISVSVPLILLVISITIALNYTILLIIYTIIIGCIEKGETPYGETPIHPHTNEDTGDD